MKGLDADTASKCFAAIFGRNGLLRKRRTTIIMATHNGMQALRFVFLAVFADYVPAQWFPYADRLIVLGENGTITGDGSFESLKDSNDYIRGLQFRHSSDEESGGDEVDSQAPEVIQKSEESAGQSIQDKIKVESKSKTSPADAEEKQRGKVNSSLPYYLRSLMSTTFIIFCFLIVFQTACRIIQRKSTHPKKNTAPS